MAKFDHHVNLPTVFRDNDLSILPVTRSQYIIGRYRTYQQVTYGPNLNFEPMQMPSWIESIDYANLYSEAAALNCAFNAGMINDLVGEDTLHTVSGRMSTGAFSFSIDAATDTQSPIASHLINVDNSQCEIDGGFEGLGHFVIVEAKNFAVNDFLVRQLYYPYRLWSGKLSKKIVPVLMTFSNDIFDFFVYEFTDKSHYNSLHLVRQHRYVISPETIGTGDIENVLARAQVVQEPSDVPFPQADSFTRVLDLLALLSANPLTRDDITENYEFDSRQTNYYTDAARYLGLVEKYTDADGDITFRLTQDAQLLMTRRHKVKVLELVRRVLEHQAFNESFHLTQRGTLPTIEEISQIIAASNANIGSTTVHRRASTVRAWLKWIWDQIDE